MTLVDSHLHLDFLEAPLRAPFLDALAGHGVRVVAQTLTPSGFFQALDAQAAERDGAGALWSLGLHPWMLGESVTLEHELSLFADALSLTRFIGEIGLDFSPRRLADAPSARQVETMRQVLTLVGAAAHGTTNEAPFVISVHAVRAAGAVLDLVDELGLRERPVALVMHRFGGTSDDLTRLIRGGGYLSVHPQLLKTKRGRAYAQQVPAERLLLETDLPEGIVPASGGEGEAARLASEVGRTLAQTASSLRELRGDEVAETLARTQERLFGVR